MAGLLAAIHDGPTGIRLAAERAFLRRLDGSCETPIAGLYGAGTLPEFRGQGHYRDLITARAAIAHSRGSKLLRVDALPTSLPILLRCDFTAVGETWPCQWKPQTIAE